MLTNILTKQNLKSMLCFLGALSAALLLVRLAPDALAQTEENPFKYIDDRNPTSDFGTAAKNIVNYFLYFLGFLATVIIIYGGVQYVTANGQQEKIDNAKKTITYAIIGLIIVLLSYTVVQTTLSSGQGGQPAM